MNLRNLRPVTSALIAWAVLTVLIAASLLLIFLRLGTAGFEVFIQQWPLTNLPITLASAAITWLAAGAFLYLLGSRRLHAGNALTLLGFFLVSLVYLNILRERFRYGDYTYYIDAATLLYKNQPLPGSYFYPPLWAILLQFLIPLGEEAILLILWLLNVLSLLAFYFLLHRVLEHYGFSSRLAALTTTLFMLVNVPLLRTLGYVQVNLHVLNLIFISLLLYPKRPFLSALALALAVHLKTSPAVLALAFLLERDWKWLAWFALNTILIGAMTVAVDGLSPYLDFLRNVQALAASRDTVFHDTSFDSFLRFTDPFFRIPLFWTRILIYAAKALLTAATLLVLAGCVRGQTFFTGQGRGARLLNALPPLFILMTLTSPIVWEHHGLFVALAFLLLLKKLETPAEWTWFGFAYFLEFALPTFDFYPWSYGRLFAPLICLWLMWAVSRRTGDSPMFSGLNKWLESLAGLSHARA